MRFGQTVAVADLSVEVPAGSVLAVLGPSGCGKSTLLRAVAGLEHPASGSMTYDGEPLDAIPTHRRGFALMFQDGQLFPHLDVAGNVGYPLRLRRRSRPAVAARVEELLELVSLPGMGERAVGTLSGGERQRVALARALAVSPRLLLLDEPLSALDRGLRERLAADLHDILRRAGATAMLVTHDQEEAFAVADQMAVMREGRIVQSGSIAEVWAGPVDAWTARFLGYAVVVEGAQLTALGLEGTAPVAMRRSALRLDPAGTITARVVSSVATPELTRVVLDVPGGGELPGVAEPGLHVGVGEAVQVSVDTQRTAALPSG